MFTTTTFTSDHAGPGHFSLAHGRQRNSRTILGRGADGRLREWDGADAEMRFVGVVSGPSTCSTEPLRVSVELRERAESGALLYCRGVGPGGINQYTAQRTAAQPIGVVLTCGSDGRGTALLVGPLEALLLRELHNRGKE